MVIGHVLPERNESLLEAYEKYRLTADSKTCCDYALHVGVTWWGPKVLRHRLRDPGLCLPVMFRTATCVCPLTACARLHPPGAR